MQIKKLNGWQRLWILTSLIYLAVVVFVAAVDFPSPWKTEIAQGEILENLSTKTLLLMRSAGKFADENGRIDPENVITIKFPNKTVIVPPDTKQSDLDYVNKDYCNTVIKLTNKKRISFIGTMVAVWLIPCVAVYALGLSIHWVYRGFRKVE